MEQTKKKTSLYLTWFCCLIFVVLMAACSFDYTGGQGIEESKPDIVMENIEYVRVRGGDMLARFKAEHAERWEERQNMRLNDFTFEQMEDRGETVNVEGGGKAASIQTDTGDIIFSGGIWISIESEDITISTEELEWKDKEKAINAGVEDEVDIKRSDGTSFTGIGFSADIRSRTWVFTGEVKGTYVEKDEDEEDNNEEDTGE